MIFICIFEQKMKIFEQKKGNFKKWTDRLLLTVRKLSLQLVLGLSIQPLLFPLTLFNTKFVPYTVRFRLFHSNPHNNLSSWYSYNYNLNFFRQPIPLDTRCIFIVVLFFSIKNTMFWGCVRWGNHFFVNFLKNNVHQQWGFTFFFLKNKNLINTFSNSSKTRLQVFI